jgi:hypothetical protein
MFPSTDTDRAGRPASGRRAQPAPARPAPAPSLLHRVAGALRAFALLEDPDLEQRVAHDARDAREAAVLHAHHRRPAAASRPARARRPGAVRAKTQDCTSPLPR